MHKCLIDGREFDTKTSLHSYIGRSLKVKISDYYHKFFPRKDLLTGELINFKNEDFYFHTLFNTRENLVSYFKKNPKDVSSLIECLKLRKEVKSLFFSPSTSEARTSILPTPLLVGKIGYDYNEICQKVGLVSRYDYSQVLEIESKIPLSVLIDSREQKPLKFRNGIVSKLDFGDYTSSSHYKKVFVERKSLPDLCGTLSKGFDRFEREIARAKSMGAYLVVCIEEDLSSLVGLDSAPHLKHIRASSDFIGARMRAICQSFDNIQFLFIGGRGEMTETVEKIFRLKNDVRSIDLQYEYDAKHL